MCFISDGYEYAAESKKIWVTIWVKQGNGFVNPALFLPEVGKIDGHAQFPEFAAWFKNRLFE